MLLERGWQEVTLLFIKELYLSQHMHISSPFSLLEENPEHCFTGKNLLNTQ
jgi:hypothetical protein